MAGAGRNMERLVSQKGNAKLVVDHYLFICNGKRKPGHANVRYWSCNTNGCNVRPKRNGNNLVDLMGVVNPPDSGDANDHDRVNDPSRNYPEWRVFTCVNSIARSAIWL